MRRVVFACLLLFLSTPTWARDLNRQNYLLGERASGMGGAFVSMVGDATSSYYNPAGLAGLFKKGISLSASAYQFSQENYPRLLDLGLDSGSRLTTNMKSSSFSTFPSSIVYLLPLDNNKNEAAFHHVLAFSALVPDYDKLKAEMDTPVGKIPFELKGTYLNQDVTYWLGPSYAASFGGRLRVGVSCFLLAHFTETQAKLGLKLSGDDGAGGTINVYSSSVMDRDGFSLQMLALAGVQYDLTDRVSFGLSLRTPSLGRIYSKVSILELNSDYRDNQNGEPLVTAENPGYVDRIEAKEGVRLNHKTPFTLALGVSYQVKDVFSVALDGTLQFAQQAYKRFDGAPIYPTDALGHPVLKGDRALDPVEEVQTKPVANANLGVEVVFSRNILGRFGIFTDFSAVDQDFYGSNQTRRLSALTSPALTRIGFTVGLGLPGERTTTSFGLAYVAGFGSTFGLNELFPSGGDPSKIDVTTHTLTAVLSGSADL